jgi:chorismate synthase
MGATVMLDSRTATFVGSGKLNGAPVDATDLRAGAALVIAGLAADGITKISNVDYIYRGYDNIVEKLSKLGAKISEVTLPDPELIQKANREIQKIQKSVDSKGQPIFYVIHNIFKLQFFQGIKPSKAT